MSSILRHRAAAVGLALTKDGFAVVEALLAVPSMAKLGATVRDVRTVSVAHARPAFGGGKR